MALLDWGIIGVIALFCILGLIRGTKVSLFSVFMWILIIVISFSLQTIVQDYVSYYGLRHHLSNYLVSALSLAIILIGLSALLRLLCTPILISNLTNPVTRILGGLFGGVHGALILTYWIGVFLHTPFYFNPARLAATLLPYFEQAAIWAQQHKLVIAGLSA